MKPCTMLVMMKRHKAPGKAHREGITVVQLMDMFPDEEAARQWVRAKAMERPAALRTLR